MGTVLTRSFYSRDVVTVARDLLGARVVRREDDGSLSSALIVETEAYSQSDPASHSFRGRTARTSVMFGEPGLAYVYLIYGMYFCFNVSCEPEGTGAAVLFRAAEPECGSARMLARHKPGKETFGDPLTQKQRATIASGPGKLCQALAITRGEHNGVDLCDRNSPLWIEAAEAPVSEEMVLRGRRIGIRQAQENLWRFGMKNSYALSPYRFQAE